MHAVSTITAASLPPHSDLHDSEEAEEDEGPFFDLDFSSSVRSSSSSSDEDHDYFIVSLHRSRSASPSYGTPTLQFFPLPPRLQFCASEPSAKTGLLQSQYKRRSTNPRTLSFGAKKTKTKAAAAFYGGRPSSTWSLRLFMESPVDEEEDGVDAGSEPATKTKRGGAPSIKRYLTNISRLLRRSVRRPRPGSGDPRRGLHRHLRKSRSASAAVTTPVPPPSRLDDSLAEKQDGIASAIAHCKESFRRASLSECDSPLLRSRSDPGKCDASS